VIYFPISFREQKNTVNSPNPLQGKIDRCLIEILQNNARTTLAEMAEQVHLSISQTQRRLKRLEEDGVIRGYSARIDAAAVGMGVMTFAEVTLKNQATDSAEKFHRAIRDIPQILECHRVSGDCDYLLKILSADLKEYSRFAQTTLMAIPQVNRLRSLIVFESPKDTAHVPVLD